MWQYNEWEGYFKTGNVTCLWQSQKSTHWSILSSHPHQVEWMSDKLMRCFEDKRNNPFQFRHLSLCHSLADLARVPSPKVVLCSQPDLESGFSRELFLQWCTEAKNSIILTYRTSPGTLARYLIDNPGEKMLDLEVRAHVCVCLMAVGFKSFLEDVQ